MLNRQYNLSNEEESTILNIQQTIAHGFTTEQKNTLCDQPINSKVILIDKLATNLADIKSHKSSLLNIKKEIEDSFNNLHTILESRNELSNILKDFNNSTKSIINEKEKLVKLNKNIEKIYKIYEETKSILAFFDSTTENIVEKIRFTSDYEEIENGISFFSLNSKYIEATEYLNTYHMLKRIAITRHYQYISNQLQNYNYEGITINDELFNIILKLIPKNIDSKYYNFPITYEKMKVSQLFFEKKSNYDEDVKRVLETLKQNYIKQRMKLLKPFYNEIFFNMNNDLKNVNNDLSEIMRYTICEIIYFVTIFQSKILDSVYIIQNLTSDIYDSLYNTLRPIIVSSDSLDELFFLMEGLSDNFNLFFLENEDKEFVINYFRGIIDEDIISKYTHNIFEMIKISKILVRPTIMKLVQDTQEKIFFRINQHIKSNFLELENDFSNISNYENIVSKTHKHFPIFHFFLRRMSVILEILKNKLDQNVLNELIVFSIEKFILILNSEILSKRNNLTISFQIYIIQQIILAIKLIEEAQVDAIETGIEIDFYSITDIFKNNINNIFNIKDIIVNSAPKVFDKTRDFKKILYNNLLKSYKILINIVNENLFGRNLMDIVYKIRNKEKIDNIEDKIKVETFQELYTSFEKIILEVKTQIKTIDTAIAEKIISMIVENINNIISQIKQETIKYDNLSANTFLQCEEYNHNLVKIKDSLFE
jgi:hypothetical protein